MRKYSQSVETRIRSTRPDTKRVRAFILKNNQSVILRKSSGMCPPRVQMFDKFTAILISIIVGVVRPAYDVLLSFGMC